MSDDQPGPPLSPRDPRERRRALELEHFFAEEAALSAAAEG